MKIRPWRQVLELKFHVSSNRTNWHTGRDNLAVVPTHEEQLAVYYPGAEAARFLYSRSVTAHSDAS